MDAVKVLENHFGSNFYRVRISGDFHHILNAMEEYANIKAREAAEKAWDQSDKTAYEKMAYPYVKRGEYGHTDKEEYLNQHYPLPQPPKKNIMKRNNGYYWVFYVNHWEISEWNGEYFYLPGDELGHEAEEFEKIYETPITRNEEYNNKNKYCNH